MASIFDMGDTPITPEYLEKLGFEPKCGGREYVIVVRAINNGKHLWCKVVYRKRNPSVPKGEQHHHALLIHYFTSVYFGYKDNHSTEIYRNIRSEFELISHIRRLESELGVKILANKEVPSDYWTNI